MIETQILDGKSDVLNIILVLQYEENFVKQKIKKTMSLEKRQKVAGGSSLTSY